ARAQGDPERADRKESRIPMVCCPLPSRPGRMLRNLLLAATSTLFALLLMGGPLRLRYEPPPIWIEPQTKHLRSPLLGWVLPPSTHSYTIHAPVPVNPIGLP